MIQKNKTHPGREEIRQPLTPEQVDPAQKAWQKEEMRKAEGHLTLNPGDRIDESKTLEEKAQQVAVDAPDIAGHVTVPTYFIVDYPNGERKALHHVRDAQAISDVIRQARMDEHGNQIWC
jgi:hypothetical protein